MKTGPWSVKNEGPLKVAVGSRIEVELVSESGEIERLSLVVVPDTRADFASGYLGAGTPLARTLLGKTAGTAVAYGLGDIVEVRLLSIVTGAVTQAPDAAAAREAVIKKAVDKSELADTLRLALTVDVKWGVMIPRALPLRKTSLRKTNLVEETV